MTETTKIRVAVTGAVGKMGREVVRTVAAQPDMELVAAVDQVQLGKDIGVLVGTDPLGVTVRSDLEQALKESKAQVMVDFSNLWRLWATFRRLPGAKWRGWWEPPA